MLQPWGTASRPWATYGRTYPASCENRERRPATPAMLAGAADPYLVALPAGDRAPFYDFELSVVQMA